MYQLVSATVGIRRAYHTVLSDHHTRGKQGNR